MQLKNSYYYFQSAIPPETCQRIIEAGNKRIKELEDSGKDVEAYTFGEMQKGAHPEAAPQGEMTREEIKEKGINDIYVRDSKATWLNDQWIYDLIWPYIHAANLNAGWNFQVDYAESFQFTVYEPGGFYSYHKDGGSDHLSAWKRYIYGVTPEPLKSNDRLPHGYTTDSQMVGKVRKISLTCNLNVPGDYEGGNLMFDFGPNNEGDRFHECTEIRPQGSIIVFPSFLDHCVTPVTTGKRYSLVLWVLGYPFR